MSIVVARQILLPGFFCNHNLMRLMLVSILKSLPLRPENQVAEVCPVFDNFY